MKWPYALRVMQGWVVAPPTHRLIAWRMGYKVPEESKARAPDPGAGFYAAVVEAQKRAQEKAKGNG
jgi:hypothetical protein